METENTVKPSIRTKTAFDKLFEELVKCAQDRDFVRSVVDDRLKDLPAKEIVVKASDMPDIKLAGHQHYLLETLVKFLSANIDIYLHGPGGSAKTTLALKAAEALGLEHELVPLNSTMTANKAFLGQLSRNGQERGPLIRAMTEGKILIVDEADTNSEALMALNSPVAQREISVDGEVIKAKEGFHVILTANTSGNGASTAYCSREQIDKASLDRFAFLEVPIDNSLEASFLGITEMAPSYTVSAGGVPTPAECLDRIRATRKAVTKLNLDVLVSPRATLLCAKLLAVGVGRQVLEDCVILRGLDKDVKSQIHTHIGRWDC